MDTRLPLSNGTNPDDDVSEVLSVVTLTLGWLATAAWSLSFYPQVFINWRRKSVVGLSLDFVAFDFVGFIAYSTFNVGMLWIPTIQQEYEARSPNSSNPVSLADVVFSLHGLLLITTTLIQCILYERGGQRVSEWTRVCLVVLSFITVASLMVPIATQGQETETWDWLDSLYLLSYIKVVATALKYWPQSILNYRRKSTVGWSIHNVLLDFIGCWITLLQMFLEACYTESSRDFDSIAKYWLCVITLVFDTVFLVQHYALYSRKQPAYTRFRPIPGADPRTMFEGTYGAIEAAGNIPRDGHYDGESAVDLNHREPAPATIGYLQGRGGRPLGQRAASGSERTSSFGTTVSGTSQSLGGASDTMGELRGQHTLSNGHDQNTAPYGSRSVQRPGEARPPAHTIQATGAESWTESEDISSLQPRPTTSTPVGLDSSFERVRQEFKDLGVNLIRPARPHR